MVLKNTKNKECRVGVYIEMASRLCIDSGDVVFGHEHIPSTTTKQEWEHIMLYFYLCYFYYLL